MKQILAVDIGGSKIKVMVFTANGRAITNRIREKTPRPATPAAVIETIVGLAKKAGSFDCVSVGFPGVVIKGRTLTAVNLHPRWEGFHFEKALSRALKKPVRVANDADVQGMASIIGQGVELVVTLGTGVGSGLFYDGKLVPNLELGHQNFRGKKTYEDILGEKSLKKKGKKKWNKELRAAIQDWASLFNFDRLHLGGGNAVDIIGNLPPKVRVVSNKNGLLGGVSLWRS